MSQQEHYIHSFRASEQERLLHQARFLSPYIHTRLDLSGEVLEVGCGVGAQIQVLLECFPDARFTGIDRSPAQIDRATEVLAPAIRTGRARLLRASGAAMPFADASFQAVCIFFVLEHLADPLPILREAMRVLRPGCVLYCTEVFNSGLYARPRQPALEEYWQAFNTLQAEMGGDPDVGIRLPALLTRAGFEAVDGYETSPLLDARTPDPDRRRVFLAFWQTLLLSGAPQLESHGRIGADAVQALVAAFAALADDPDAIFRYCAFQARGCKPAPTPASDIAV